MFRPITPWHLGVMTAHLRLLPLFAALFAIQADAADVVYAKATLKRTLPSCTEKGQFLDGRLDDPSVGFQCWSCPSGYNRTASAVTANDACVRQTESLVKATFKHHFSCDGSKREFFDPRKHGECWTCPKDRPRRTLYAVTSDKACATSEIIGEKLAKAHFEHKSKSCGGGSFYDPRKGGECWECPGGYGRTLDAVTSDSACSKAGGPSPAHLVGSMSCGDGEFLDVWTGGCYTCPSKAKIRTLYKVTDDRACTNDLSGMLDLSTSTASCKAVVSGINTLLQKGEDGVKEFNAAVKPFEELVQHPLMDRVQDVVEDAENAGGVKAMVTAQLKPRVADFQKQYGYVIDFTSTFAKSAEAVKAKVLLDPNVICSGNGATIEAALKSAFGAAYTASSKQFITVSINAEVADPEHHVTAQIAVTLVTNLTGQGALLLSTGFGASTSDDPVSVSVSAMIYPNTTLDTFGVDASSLVKGNGKPTDALPGLGASLSKGKKIDELLTALPEIGPVLAKVDSLDVAWAPNLSKWPPPAQSLPTFGISKGIYPPSNDDQGQHPFDVGVGMGWDVRLFKW